MAEGISRTRFDIVYYMGLHTLCRSGGRRARHRGHGEERRGAVGSLIAQFFHLTGAERKTLLVAGALSAGLTQAVYATKDAFERLPVHCMWSSIPSCRF